MFNTIPVVAGNFVFADVPSGYFAVSDNEKFTQCFLAYCKSRDTNIVGGGANLVSTFTYSAIVKAASQVGVDITRLQAELYYKQENNGAIQWFMTSTGVSAFNEIFAQLITDAGLEVGDTDVNDPLYSGEYFIDDNGNTCLVSICNTNSTSFPYRIGTSSITTVGTYFIKQGGINAKNTYDSGTDIDGNHTRRYFSFAYKNNTYNVNIKYSGDDIYQNYYAGNSSVSYYYTNAGSLTKYGFPVIWKGISNNFYYGVVCYNSNGSLSNGVLLGKLNNVDDTSNITINIVTINNKPIKNEYQGDTYITNEGDTINNYPTDPDPDYDPYPDGGGTITNPVNPSDPNGGDNINVNFPDIDLDLPEIDWSIGDLSNKFPFSIPFDLYNMFSILNVEPQTPEIQGNVNLGIYQWAINWDLHQFDDTARLLRNVEFIGFVIGLIFITRNIIKG